MKKNFLRKALSITLAAAFVATSIPGTALIANAAVTTNALTPKYQYDFENNLTEKSGEITAVAKAKAMAEYSGEVSYDTGREGTGNSINLAGSYGLDLNVPNMGTAYTISLWAKPAAGLSDNTQIMFLGTNTPAEDWIGLAGNTNKALKLWTREVIDKTQNGWKIAVDNAVYTLNEWQQYILSVDNGTASLYRNGVLLGSGSVSATSFSREASDLYLGVNFWPDGLFNGSIDEVKVYDTAVSAAEAKALYNGGIAVSGDSSNKVVGDTVELDAVVTDGTEGATIAWTSSNEEIATVADGIVTCVGEGKVGIKASLMNGETEIASDTFTIVVDLENPLSVYVNDIANFTFDDEATGFSGAGAKAVVGNGTLADMLVTEEGEDGRKVVQFEKSNSEFLNVVAEDDSSLLTGVKDMKVSFDWKTSGAASDWPFFAAPNTNTQEYLQEHYIGVITDSGHKVTAQRYNGGARQPSVVSDVPADTWTHIDLVLTETSMIMYVEGTKVGSVANPFALTEILGDASVIQLGKANWGAGEYSDGYLDNFSISVRTDLTALKAAVADAKTKVEADYSAASWATFAEKLGAAEAAIAKAGTTQAEAEAAAEELATAQAALEEKPAEEKENIALTATASESFSSAWTGRTAVLNDSITTIPDGADNMNPYTWATWGNKSASEYIQYNWDTPVVIESSDLYLWIDNGGIHAPVSYTYEYQAEDSDEWVELLAVNTDISVGTQGVNNSVTFENPVTAIAIRCTLTKDAEDTNGVGVTEWEVYGKEAEKPATGLVKVASYDMSAADGKLVDTTGNGHDASYVGFEDADFQVEGEDKTLVFPGLAGKYVNIPAGIITGEEFAVEATFKTSTVANSWLWCLGTKVASWPNVTNYLFVSPKFEGDVLRAGIKDAETEKLFENTGSITSDTYVTVRVEFNNGDMSLLVDGTEISTMSTGYSIQEILEAGTTDDVCGFIGKSTYADDPAFTGTLTQFDIYATEVPADKTELRAAVDNAVPAEDESKYTAGSWAAYKAALEAAQAVLANENATQNDVDDALAALEEAKEALTEDIRKNATPSSSADTYVQYGQDASKFADDDANSFLNGWWQKNKADDWASEVQWMMYDFGDKTAEISACSINWYDNTITGDGGVVAPTAIKIEYMNEKDEWVEVTPSGEWTYASKNATDEADVYGFEPVQTSKIRVTVTEPGTFNDDTKKPIAVFNWSLTGKMVETEEPTEIDKTVLQAAVDNAVPAEDESKYTANSWAAYKVALEAAQAVLANDKATQNDVDDALAALEEAKEALTEEPEPIESNVLADFNFDAAPAEGEGFDGGNATATGTYELVDHGTGKALKLNGTDQFLTVTDKDGNSLLTGVKELTVSFQMNPGQSATNWGFFAAPNASQQTYRSEKFLGIFDNGGTVKAERYNSNSMDRPVSPTYAAGKNKWSYITVVYTETETILYVNGVERGREDSIVSIPELLGDNSILYIGKSTWESGEYMTGLIDNYKIVKGAVPADVIAAEAAKYVEKDALQAAIDATESVGKEDEYTPSTWKAYADALAAAKTVLADDAATQAEVDAAATALTSAQKALKKVADKTALDAAIKAAIPADKKDNYTEDSWAAYEKALETAKTVSADAEATQTKVDSATKALTDAQKALKPAVASITVTAPTKTEYVAGEDLDLAGMKVVVTYVDGTEEEITEGYEVSGYDADKVGEQTITVTYGKEATFTVTVIAAELPFVDVSEDDWFYDAVYYNYFAGTMTGLNEDHFGPAQSLARAQFAVILYRMNDTPEVDYEAIFPDVEDDVWYTDAILWAADTGVVTGYTDTGKFGPADLINREQMAVMMYRYASYKGYESDESADISGYADAGKVSAFAKDAMEWAVGNGIISGKNEGTILDPQGNATRAECATIIMRFIEKFEK